MKKFFVLFLSLCGSVLCAHPYKTSSNSEMTESKTTSSQIIKNDCKVTDPDEIPTKPDSSDSSKDTK